MERLVSVSPLHLSFQITLHKLTYTHINITNTSSSPVTYKVKTTNLKRYCVRPNAAILQPTQNIAIEISQQAFKTFPEDIDQCSDRFLLMVIPLQQIPLGPSSDADKVSRFHGYDSVMDIWNDVHEENVFKKKMTVSLQVSTENDIYASEPVPKPAPVPFATEKPATHSGTFPENQKPSEQTYTDSSSAESLVHAQSPTAQPPQAPPVQEFSMTPKAGPTLQPPPKCQFPPQLHPIHQSPSPSQSKGDTPPPPIPKRENPPPQPPKRDAPPPPLPPKRDAPPPLPPKRVPPSPPPPPSRRAPPPPPLPPPPPPGRDLSPPPPPLVPISSRAPEPAVHETQTEKMLTADTTDARTQASASTPPGQPQLDPAPKQKETSKPPTPTAQQGREGMDQVAAASEKAVELYYLSPEFERKRVLEMRTAPKITVPKLLERTRQRIANERAGQIAKAIEDRQRKIDGVKLELREARHRLSDARMATSPAYDVAYEISENSRVPFAQIVIMAIISGALLQLLV
ncbi:unnamed protein product [Agarophyton chilense]